MKKVTKYKLQQVEEAQTTNTVALNPSEMTKSAQLVYYKDKVAELQSQVHFSNTEQRLLKEDNHQLTRRCERYERLLDHLTGHIR